MPSGTGTSTPSASCEAGRQEAKIQNWVVSMAFFPFHVDTAKATRGFVHNRARRIIAQFCDGIGPQRIERLIVTGTPSPTFIDDKNDAHCASDIAPSTTSRSPMMWSR